MRSLQLLRSVVVALVALPFALPAQQGALATQLGFSGARLTRIDSAFQRAVDSGQIAGAVALVLRDGHPVYERAFGWADRESKRRMTTDAIFRIASQTKALTSVAIMSLVEEGKLSLTDPVSRFIPAFEHTTVAIRADTGRAIVPARRGITIHDLLTHTSGISYGVDSLVAPLSVARGLGRGARLLSTARDYPRFLQMLLNGGVLDDVRVLAPRTVADDEQPVGDALLAGR